MTSGATNQHGLPSKSTEWTGVIVRANGSVVNVQCKPNHLPPLLNVVEIEQEAAGPPLLAYVVQYLGDDLVRCLFVAPAKSGRRVSLRLGMRVKDLMMRVQDPLDTETIDEVITFLRQSQADNE